MEGKREEQNILPTLKHRGDGILVSDCMSQVGVGILEFIEGIIDQHVYIAIFKK